MGCDKDLKELWEKHGISTLLNSLARVLRNDAKLVEATGKFPEEVAVKLGISETLNNGACYFTQLADEEDPPIKCRFCRGDERANRCECV